MHREAMGSSEESVGIDAEHDYEPKYITIRGKETFWPSCKEVKKADKIYLATTLTARERPFAGI